MANSNLYRIKTVTEIHLLMGLPKPQHPLIGIIDLSMMPNNPDIKAVVFDLYVVILKRGCDKLHYGKSTLDFDEGLMAFMSPGQILRGETNGVPNKIEGWMLFIHPDFLWGTSLAKNIRNYEFFDYSVTEALFLSDKEEKHINEIAKHIKNEYNANIDNFSQSIMISHIETLLNYSERFYNRQFITRKITNNTLLNKLELLLDNCFKNKDLLSNGLPSVQYFADELHLSSKYLSTLLKSLTGKTAQEHIHEKLIETAKEKLSTTNLSVSEIAYELGFEHPQSFNKLFKTKTNLSPLKFRQSFN